MPRSSVLHLGTMGFKAFLRELSEGEQHVQGQPAHACGRVELLGYRNKRDALGIEGFHDLSKVEQRTRQPVDFVDDHHVDLAGANIVQELFEGRAVQHSPDNNFRLSHGGDDSSPSLHPISNAGVARNQQHLPNLMPLRTMRQQDSRHFEE
jgi:hypothetical protein